MEDSESRKGFSYDQLQHYTDLHISCSRGTYFLTKRQWLMKLASTEERVARRVTSKGSISDQGACQVFESYRSISHTFIEIEGHAPTNRWRGDGSLSVLLTIDSLALTSRFDTLFCSHRRDGTIDSNVHVASARRRRTQNS